MSLRADDLARLRRRLEQVFGETPCDAELASRVLQYQGEDRAAAWCQHEIYQAARDAYKGELKLAFRSFMLAQRYMGKSGFWPSALAHDVAIDVQNYLEDMFKPMAYPDGSTRHYQS